MDILWCLKFTWLVETVGAALLCGRAFSVFTDCTRSGSCWAETDGTSWMRKNASIYRFLCLPVNVLPLSFRRNKKWRKLRLDLHYSLAALQWSVAASRWSSNTTGSPRESAREEERDGVTAIQMAPHVFMLAITGSCTNQYELQLNPSDSFTLPSWKGNPRGSPPPPLSLPGAQLENGSMPIQLRS